MERRRQTGTNAVAFIFIGLGILVLVNILSTRVFGRLDLTGERIFTLSSASRDLVRNLPDRLTVKAFISKDLDRDAPQLAVIGRYLRDILDEYAAYSKGKLAWEAIDPAGDAKLEEEANRLKVPKLRLQVLRKEKVELGSTYLGVAFQYGGNIESIPQVTSMEGLEYQISSLIKRLTVKKRKLAFSSGHGEPESSRGLQIAHQALDEYEVTTVNFAAGQPAKIPDDVDVLVVFGPKQPFSEEQKKEIDRFLMQGKAAAFFLDGMTMEQPRGMMPPEMMGQANFGRKNDTGLEDLLAAYGLKVNDDLVMEARMAAAGPVSVQGQTFLVPYPIFPVMTTLAPNSTITEKLRGFTLPYSSSVELLAPLRDKPAGIEVIALAKSTPEAWHQTGFFMLDPQRKLEPAKERATFVMGYQVRGKLKSYAAAKSPAAPPPPQNVSTAEPTPAAPAGEAKAPARLVVFGGSQFANDQYLMLGQRFRLPEYQQNLILFLNIVDWLSADETLSAVRAKGVQARPLKLSSERTPTVVKYANTLGVPLLLVGYGIVRWRLRRARRAHARF